MILRGKHKHEKLIREISPTDAITEVKGGKLIDKKYETLFYRYYYYSRLMKLKYADMITILENEFFISGGRIIDLVAANSGRVSEIFSEACTVKQLAEKFPSYNWPKPIEQPQQKVNFISI